ncbi:histone H2B-like [Parasteatoda tepidariorum]|uniref:histone H2B-like n=1 Tax=Parasteatoda tepidariorum TaxID=114398 RepID=UPI001C71A391|nr:late histone H2B.L4-like [Parasteatoda tepidariorum]
MNQTNYFIKPNASISDRRENIQKITRKKLKWHKFPYGSFQKYIRQVKKTLIPESKLSSMTLKELDDILTHILDRIETELQRLIRLSNSKTITTRQLEFAVRLCLPEHLGRLAANYGNSASRVLNNGLVPFGDVRSDTGANGTEIASIKEEPIN